MIISASRRTDIPAFYSRWLMNRIRAGCCKVPNPFNPKQVSEIQLNPEAVDAVVFWTRYPKPLIPHLKELDDRGFYYYFQYTITGYGPPVEMSNPPLEKAIRCFREVSDHLGPRSILWRYDPILLNSLYTTDYHYKQYAKIANFLKGYTFQSVISMADFYKKTVRRLSFLADQGIAAEQNQEEGLLKAFLSNIKEIADHYHMEMVSCAEEADFSDIGILPGKCIDNRLLAELFPDRTFSAKKDPGQRKACGCVQSRDIGMTDSCLFRCRYCYATRSHDLAKRNYTEKHFPDSPSLLGRI